MIAKLEAGIEIVTIGGIYGTIVQVGEKRIRIRVADGSELEIAPRSISALAAPSEPDEIEALQAAGVEESEDSTPVSGDDRDTDA